MIGFGLQHVRDLITAEAARLVPLHDRNGLCDGFN
jgi:hypothetical protein